jgi:hypothetical protein
MRKIVSEKPVYILNESALTRIRAPWHVATANGKTRIELHDECVAVNVSLNWLPVDNKNAPPLVTMNMRAVPVDENDLHAVRVCLDTRLAMQHEDLTIGGVHVFGDLLSAPSIEVAPDADFAYMVYRARMADEIQAALGLNFTWASVRPDVLGDRLTLELLTASLVDHTALAMHIYDDTAFAVYFVGAQDQFTVPDFQNHRKAQFITGQVMVVVGSVMLAMQLVMHMGFTYDKNIIPVQTGAAMLVMLNDDVKKVASKYIESFLNPVDIPLIMKNYQTRYGEDDFGE